jgi:hypothetical protein
MVIVGQISNNMITARRFSGGTGTQTAALAFGGTTSSSWLQEQQKNMMELVGHHPTGLNTARYGLAGAGTQTAALAFGGYTGSSNSGATEEYDGS